MNILKFIIGLILLLLHLDAKELEKVSIQLNSFHKFQFAGYYIAKEKGYYEDLNLDVDIKEFNFDINLVNDVIKQKSEYAVGNSSLIIDKLENKNIILISAIFQNSPKVLLTLKSSNIIYPNNLKDKKIMLNQNLNDTASIKSMLISQGLQLNDIKFLKHSNLLDDLINGKTDAFSSDLSTGPYLLSQKNIEFNVHNPSDYGFYFYSGILFTSKKELNKYPLRVKKIYKATKKGWEYAFKNIEETSKLIFNKYNTKNKTLDALIYEGQVLKRLAKFNEGKLGNINIKKIDDIKRLFLLLGLNKYNSNVKLNDFIYDSTKISLSKKEQEYLDKNKLTLVTNTFSQPFTIKSKKGLNGIEIDIWNLINKKLKIRSNVKIINNHDLAIEKIKKNKNRVKFIFSKDEFYNSLPLTKTISKIKVGIATSYEKEYISHINELNGKKIAILKNSSLYLSLKKNYPDIEFILINSLKEGFKFISQKKVFALIGKLPSISYVISQNNLTNIKIAGTINNKFESKLIVNNENKILITILNKVINTLSDEEINNIKHKYYSVIYDTSIDYFRLFKIVFPILIILIIIGISNRKLNNEIKKRKIIEEELHIVANIDSLTKIYNRRKIEKFYTNELLRVKRYERDLSIIFLDIDNFKLINDSFGHSAADEVLTKLAYVIKNNIRSSDYFGRWGGEEFIIILPETDKLKAHNLAYIIKEKINSTDFNIERSVTCSFGVSQYEETDSKDSLLTRADNAMYYVKNNGKNGVKVV